MRLGIIEPVPPDTPTIWCSRMVVVAKKDGSPRHTIDLQRLNEATYRDTHHTSSPFILASAIPPNTRKTILDAWNAYLLLSEEASDATTFITEWGRYRYLHGPQGFKASGDAYTKANVLMIPSYRIKTSKKASGTLSITSSTALKMELSSTQQNSDSARQRSTLLVSMSPKMALNLPNPSSIHLLFSQAHQHQRCSLLFGLVNQVGGSQVSLAEQVHSSIFFHLLLVLAFPGYGDTSRGTVRPGVGDREYPVLLLPSFFSQVHISWVAVHRFGGGSSSLGAHGAPGVLKVTSSSIRQ